MIRQYFKGERIEEKDRGEGEGEVNFE